MTMECCIVLNEIIRLNVVNEFVLDVALKKFFRSMNSKKVG